MRFKALITVDNTIILRFILCVRASIAPAVLLQYSPISHSSSLQHAFFFHVSMDPKICRHIVRGLYNFRICNCSNLLKVAYICYNMTMCISLAADSTENNVNVFDALHCGGCIYWNTKTPD